MAQQTSLAGVSQWQRPLLPAAVLAESDGSRTPRDWIVDALMYVLCGGFGAVILGSTASYRSMTTIIIDGVCGVVALIALWWRREHPGIVALVVLSLSAFSGMAAGAALAATFNAALRMPMRRVGAVAAWSCVTAAVSAYSYGNADGYDTTGVVIGLLATAIVVVSGLFTRAQRDLVVSLHERAVRLVAEQRLHEEAARSAERRRIAREMHDVLAHRISLLSVHAGALEFRPDAPPEAIAEAAGVVRSSAHAALQELRDVIGMLREDDVAEATGPPQPTLCDVPALVEESRAAGTRVELDFAVPEGALPDALGRTAYRIVQEGLTNARKHAVGAAVSVRVALDADAGLEVRVASRAAVAGDAVPPPPGAGTGLIGLRERVVLAGGALEHGRAAGGDFVLRAVLPVAEGVA
ncbi:sensor histidine kinase [Baekduia sp. Peel2402]|uniref:sensor histidine kinase n=1 Tax=Baekduia sp. Peel2402 TaxID=3458296 RepID=UPI00403EC066